MIALVKHVPDIQSRRTLSAEGQLERGGRDDTLNELDEDCLEAALRLVETAARDDGGEGDGREDGDGAHRVTALTVGPPAAVGALRRALAMGATEAVHVCDEAITGSDAIATARVVAAAVQRVHADHPVHVVMAGMAALDGLTSLLPSAVAALLGWPQLTLADRVAAAAGPRGTTVTVRRTTAHHVEELQAPAPAVVSVTDQAFRPRSPDVKGILAARRKPVAVLALADLDLQVSGVGVTGSGTRVLRADPRPERQGRVRLTDGPELASELADQLSLRGFC